MKKVFFITIISLIAISSSAQQIVDTTRVFGVTIADPWTNVTQLKDALSSHCMKPTARIVFDEWQAASDYYSYVSDIATTCFVMGEILDSYYVPDYSVTQYLNRTTEYLDIFEDIVGIWEVGNEVNGDWLGSTSDVIQKIEGAYGLVKARGKKTELTLYYNRDCFYSKPEHEMFTWVHNNISDSVKQGLDYVLISYYEDDCEDVILTEAEWQEVFDSLHIIFPNSKLGMGECGTTISSKKAEYMNRYYNMHITTPNYIGGYFWWYYKSYPDVDCVPKTKALWDTLNNISCDWVLTTNTSEQIEQERIKIYPIPTTNILYIENPSKIINSIEVFNEVGMLVGKCTNMEFIDVSMYPNGLFLLKVTMGKEIEYIKFLVQ